MSIVMITFGGWGTHTLEAPDHGLAAMVCQLVQYQVGGYTPHRSNRRSVLLNCASRQCAYFPAAPGWGRSYRT
jgi:hypothetical protein